MQLEVAPELKQLNPQFEAADVTGPSIGQPISMRVVFEALQMTSGVVDRLLPLRSSGRSVVVCLYHHTIDVVPALFEPAVKDLTTAIEAIRRTSGLPVNEVAEMVGLSRRGLYKIINEGRTAAATEEHILRIAAVISKLQEVLTEPHLVRAALLTPLRNVDDRTFIEVAGTRDVNDIRTAADTLLTEEGSAAIHTQWRRTRPLGSSGAAATSLIQESVNRPT